MKSLSTTTNQPTTTIQQPTPRQAAILVCVLVCLAVAITLVTSTVRTALGARRAMRTQHQVRQTELLLAAGVQRATRQLQATADYAGETWTLSPQAIPGAESALVKIDVAPAAEDSPRTVRVTARLSTGAHAVVQRSYIFPIDPLLPPDK